MIKKEISKKTAKDLIENPTLKAELMAKKVFKELDAKEVYLLANDSIVIFKEDQYFTVSFEEYFNFSIKKDKVFLEPPLPSEVLKNAEKELALFFKFFPRNRCDFSIKSLDYLDKEYPKLEKEGVQESELLLPLVVYIGELMIKETDGDWYIKSNGNKDVLTVKGKNGKYNDPYFTVLNILTRGHKPHDFYSKIRTELNLNPINFKVADKSIIPLEELPFLPKENKEKNKN